MRRLSVLLLLAITCVGCATHVLTPDSKLAAENGVAIVRVVGNLEFPEWQQIWVRGESDGELYDLTTVPCAVRGSYVFAAGLPAQRYSPEEMVAWFYSGSPQTGSIQFEVRAPIKGRAGTFVVEPGRVTNLGTIVYQPGKDLGANKSEFFLAVDPKPLPAKSLLASAYPEVARAVHGQPELGWEKLHKNPKRAAIVKLAKDSAGGLSSLVATERGALYAGTRMGQVITMPRLGGKWQRFDTGSLESITAVLPLPGGAILAGGEQGLVTHSADGGRSWKKLAVTDLNHMVTFLGRGPKGHLVLVAESKQDIVVYASQDPARGWREVRRFVFPDGNIWWGPQSYETAHNVGGAVRREAAVLSDSRLFVLEQPKTVWSYELATGKWEASAPAPFGIIAIRASRDGYLWAIPTNGDEMYGSGDWGKSWSELDYFLAGTPPVFANRRNGYLTARPNAGMSDTWKIMKTTDGGENWTATGDLPESGIAGLAFDRTGRKLIAVSRDHKLWVTSDDGKTWKEPK